MLIYTPFALCFVTLRGAFMHFLELTYKRDATVSVPCFLLFLVFQKIYTGNILGIGRNKSQSSYFSRHETESKAETEGDQGPATPYGGVGQPLAAPPGGGAT
jgi:hypothetical protein